MKNKLKFALNSACVALLAVCARPHLAAAQGTADEGTSERSTKPIKQATQ
jgi:hypothetical protein